MNHQTRSRRTDWKHDGCGTKLHSVLRRNRLAVVSLSQRADSGNLLVLVQQKPDGGRHGPSLPSIQISKGEGRTL